MTINDFNVGRLFRGAHEANPPLIVNPYRMLPLDTESRVASAAFAISDQLPPQQAAVRGLQTADLRGRRGDRP
jgi:hypothetical protein